ncbi:MAG: hypothetical protein KF767_00990 [Bdellovibrionaceae bacterium]|nr:hypothetical protein [Pseudobdellovibrionaceae bacterium]
MSQNTLLKSLERLFVAIGAFAVAVALVGVVVTVYQYHSLTSATGIAGAAARAMLEQMSPLPQFKTLVSTLSEAFLAFLVAGIFSMIRTKNAANRERNDRLMHMTCFGYVLTGLIGFASWIHWIFSANFSFMDNELIGDALQVSGLGLMGLNTLTPFIYAITVYVLYTQMARLVNFESEVI